MNLGIIQFERSNILKDQFRRKSCSMSCSAAARIVLVEVMWKGVPSTADTNHHVTSEYLKDKHNRV